MTDDYITEQELNEIITEELLAEMADNLDIILDNVIHITFTNGMEMIGEFFRDEATEREGERVIINPLRINRESFADMDNNTVYHREDYVDWSPSAQPKVVAVSVASILTTMIPTESALKTYIITVWDKYHPDIDPTESKQEQIQEKPKQKPKVTGNVIDITSILNSNKT